MKAYKKDSRTPIKHPECTVVVGGGNVAMDAARCAKRLGSDVTIVYRRTKAELPARAEEVEHAEEEGIKFAFLHNPVEVEGENGWVKAVRCQVMELSEPDESGRRKPVPVEGQFITVPCDCMIMSIGTSPNPLIKSTTEGLEVNRRGGIVINEDKIPVRPQVQAACGMLGLEPLYCANEGKLLAVVDAQDADRVIKAMRGTEEGRDAALIGHVSADYPGRLVMQTAFGGKRILQKLTGAQLPRIC